MIRSQSAGSESTNGPPVSQPALLTSTSMRPNRSVTCRTIASTDSRDVTSARMATAPAPMVSAVSLAAASLTSVTTTVAPSAAIFAAMALPMPWPAPVTTQTLSSSFPMSVPLESRRSR